jgi:hypothetical protein
VEVLVLHAGDSRHPPARRRRSLQAEALSVGCRSGDDRDGKGRIEMALRRIIVSVGAVALLAFAVAAGFKPG